MDSTADRALDFIEDGMVVGLGSGRAAEAFVRALAARVAGGLSVRGVSTSRRTEELAVDLGIPVTTVAAVQTVDVTVDGADEVDPQLDLIKGYGGALLRERIVAEISTRRVILVDETKLVPVLGTRGRLPVEVVPFALSLCMRRLGALGCPPTIRIAGAEAFATDNGNYILDCAVSAIRDPQVLDRQLRAIPGVIATGLFLGLPDIVLVQTGDAVQTRSRSDR